MIILVSQRKEHNLYKNSTRTCMVSIDVEQDIGDQKTFCGVENLDMILKIFDKFEVKVTLFVTGEVLEKYADLVKRWSKKHEIACHGYHHVPLYELPMSEREKQLNDFCRLYEIILGEKPKGFRAVQHTIDNNQLDLLEGFGFTYDSSVIPRYFPFRKYVGYKGKAPTEPYYPSYNDYRKRGDMNILEIPNTPLVFGISLYGTWIRILTPVFYQAILTMKKPEFISLAMHSWDCIKHTGAFSRNSGGRFLKYLECTLSTLKNAKYTFVNGEVCENIYKNKAFRCTRS